MATIPWVDKYRPKNVNEVAHQEEVVQTLRRALDTANLPHLLFYGPPGTGKTSTALAIARQLYGPELMKVRVMELNASDERGISVVRNKIKQFASAAIGEPAKGFPSPPYKLLILDEADSMTQDAQNALRRTMEAHSKVTRFVFICNYISRIIEPLASRCAKFRFKPMHGDIIAERISHICSNEEVVLKDDAFQSLSRVANGDLRKAITLLQSAVRLKGSPVERQTVLDVAGAVPPEVVEQLLDACRSKVFRRAQEAVTGIIADGWLVQSVLLEIEAAVLADDTLADAQRSLICTVLADADKALTDGADESIQLLNVACVTLQTMALA